MNRFPHTGRRARLRQTIVPGLGLVVAATLALVTTAAAAPTSVSGWSKKTVTLAIGTPWKLTLGVSGKAGRRVKLQARHGTSNWVTVATGRTGSARKVTFRVPSPKEAVTTYRVLVPAVAGSKALTTAPRKVIVGYAKNVLARDYVGTYTARITDTSNGAEATMTGVASFTYDETFPDDGTPLQAGYTGVFDDTTVKIHEACNGAPAPIITYVIPGDQIAVGGIIQFGAGSVYYGGKYPYALGAAFKYVNGTKVPIGVLGCNSAPGATQGKSYLYLLTDIFQAVGTGNESIPDPEIAGGASTATLRELKGAVSGFVLNKGQPNIVASYAWDLVGTGVAG